MSFMRISTSLLSMTALLVGALAANTSWAGSQVEDALSTCTTINCSSQKIRGLSQKGEPFVMQLYSKAGECLRVDIVQQSVDTEMILVRPDMQRVYYNDDRPTGGLLPLILIDPVESSGWYTLMIDKWGTPRVDRFLLKFGRYDSGNPNCQGTPTPVVDLKQAVATGIFSDVKPSYDHVDVEQEVQD